MPHTQVQTSSAPAAIGPYSQAITTPLAGRVIYTSGQIPLDPATGAMVSGDIAALTRRVLDNLGAVLAASGATFADVVKTTIFLADLADFAAVNEVYAERFPPAAGPPPARSTVQAARLPRDARVEIEAIAVVTGGAS
ncbi:MAG: Rid family detoxifying hydrolase [Kofleriaceae bacterium]|jgi:2-iminobutanoate/2-iminopropanoate deaminase|nr:Rid family detoxifying hydrolase [Kofleriaceae bacterium]